MPVLRRKEFVTNRWARRARCRWGVAFAFGLLCGEAVVAGVVPVNGRPQQMLFATTQVQDIAADTYRQRLAELSRADQLDRDPARVERVRQIAARIIAQTIDLKPEAAAWAWEIHVASSGKTDAYCMAGGKILIADAFLDDRQFNDAELAALLGHEIAHAIAEHVREELSAVPSLDPAYARFDLDDVVAVLGWDLSVTLRLAPLSRLHELEADDIGIHLAAKAGYDPRALLEFYRKLGLLDEGSDLFHSHVASNQRLRAVEAFATYAESLYKASLTAGHAPGFVLH